MTGMPSGMPKIAAAARVTAPTTSLLALTGGSFSAAISNRASSSADQQCARRSKSEVPDASERSVWIVPVKAWVTKSLGSTICCVACQTSGSCAITQSSLGRLAMVLSGLMVIRRKAAPALSSAIATSAVQRVSFHRIDFLTGTPARSRKVTPRIWPATPTAAIPSSRCDRPSRPQTSVAASTQTRGSCSTYPLLSLSGL